MAAKLTETVRVCSIIKTLGATLNSDNSVTYLTAASALSITVQGFVLAFANMTSIVASIFRRYCNPIRNIYYMMYSISSWGDRVESVYSHSDPSRHEAHLVMFYSIITLSFPCKLEIALRDVLESHLRATMRILQNVQARVMCFLGRTRYIPWL